MKLSSICSISQSIRTKLTVVQDPLYFRTKIAINIHSNFTPRRFQQFPAVSGFRDVSGTGYAALSTFPCNMTHILQSTTHTHIHTHSLSRMAANDSTVDTTVANSEQTTGIEQHKIIIENNRGEKLVGLLHETGSKEIVILCHGFTCTKEYNLMVELAVALEKQGISAFRFDFSGNGESEGTFDIGNFRKEVDDVKAVIQYFTAANRVVSAILGHSKGANTVLLYASSHHDIPAVVCVSGRYNMDIGVEGRLGKNFVERVKRDGFIDVKSKTGEFMYRVTEESVMERMTTNMHEAVQKIDKNCKVLILLGTKDEGIPIEDCYEFAKIIPNNELRVFEGADHEYSNHRDELIPTILAFIKQNLHRAA